MSIISRFLTIASLILFTSGLVSQVPFPGPDEIYGPDPLLYNGKKYTYFLPSSAIGHQYLSTTDYSFGSVTIRGKHFKAVLLNYDIYNQQLLLKFTNTTGGTSIIELSKAWLESFQFEGKDFICLGQAEDVIFYQVLGNDEARFLYLWRKDFKVEQGTGKGVFTFSTPKKSAFLMSHGEVMPFSGNRSLLKLFQEGERTGIKNYLKTNNLRVKTASDKEMADLANYISQTIK